MSVPHLTAWHLPPPLQVHVEVLASGLTVSQVLPRDDRATFQRGSVERFSIDLEPGRDLGEVLALKVCSPVPCVCGEPDCQAWHDPGCGAGAQGACRCSLYVSLEGTGWGHCSP